MSKIGDFHDSLIKRRTIGGFEDFSYYSSGSNYTTTKSSSFTVAAGNSTGGICIITGDTSANDYGYVGTTNKILSITNNYPIYIETMLQYTEQNTNAANVMFGVSSAALTSNGMQATSTGEPPSSWSGAVIYKVNGGTMWKTKSSVGSTSPGASQSNTVAGTSSATAQQWLGISIEPVSATIAEVTYYVDGQQLYVANQITPIKDQLTYTGAAQMAVFVGLMQTSTVNAEILNVDYVAYEQLVRLFTVAGNYAT
jgi:hypothetical protein